MKKESSLKPTLVLSFKKNMAKAFRKTFRCGSFQYGVQISSTEASFLSFLLPRLLLCLILCFLSFGLISCATLPETIDDLSPQSRKSKVLKILGPPFKIDREDGEDHWIYKFVEEGRHYTKTIVFKNNMLIRTKKRKPYSLKRF